MSATGGVRWSEGMLLRPQHFQQNDLFHAAQHRYLASVLHPFAWGVRRVEIDTDALENEILRVQRCEVLFPDGLVFRFPEAAELTERSFKEAFAATMESLGVYVCMRSQGTRDGGNQRVVTRTEHCPDAYDPDSEAAVEYVVPRAELMFTNNPEDERLAGFEAIRIAEVRRTGRAAPRYELSRRYIPPLLRCDASAILIAAIQQVHDQVCAAVRALARHRRERGAEGLAYGVGDLEQLLTLQALNHFAPLVQHLLAHGGGHPLELYGMLAQLRGVLTTYSAAEEPFAFPEYVHTDLGGCFLPLVESIRRLLEQLLPTHYEEVALSRDGFSFAADLDAALLSSGGAFVLALRGPGTSEALRKRIEGQAKISSVEDMRELVRFADRGVPARFVEHPPAEIPRHADHAYFTVEIGDPRWKKIRDAGNFCFYLADAEPDLNVRLFVVLRQGRRA